MKPQLYESKEIRRVSWNRLPLGVVIVEWPEIYGSSITELLDYPIITRQLRDLLFRQYRFLQGKSVVVADPEWGFSRERIQRAAEDFDILGRGIPQLKQYKKAQMEQVLSLPEARSELFEMAAYDASPYVLLPSLARSISTILKNPKSFGEILMPHGAAEMGSLHHKTSQYFAQFILDGVSLPRRENCVFHIAIDVSYSMINGDKWILALQSLVPLMAKLCLHLPVNEWKLWLLSERCVELNIDGLIGEYQNMSSKDWEQLLVKHSIEPGATRFAPFFRKVLDGKDHFRANCAVLLTDGVCQDRGAALRLAEQMAMEQINYLQIAFHHKEDLRERVILGEKGQSLDGVVFQERADSGNEKILLDDQALEELSTSILKEMTHIPEAAKGNQMILSWNPMLDWLGIEIYEQFLEQFSKEMVLF